MSHYTIAKLEVAVDMRAIVGEGALWDTDRQCLLWLDILGHKVFIYHPQTKTNRVIETCQSVGTVVPRKKGGLVVALHNGFAFIDLQTEKITPFAVDPELDRPENRFNDGKCDPCGRLWAGTMEFSAKKGAGALYCLHADHRVEEKLSNLSISNGIVWSLDEKTMYFIDSLDHGIYAFDYNKEKASISHQRLLFKYQGPGIFDGMTIDAEGLLWVAVFGGRAILVIDPATAKVVQTIHLPVSQVTSVAFGGQQMNQLYVTSATYKMSAESLAAEPLAGSLLVMETSARGVKAVPYAESCCG